MSIRFSVFATPTEGTEPVRIDAHHIASDETWFEHPIRSHSLKLGGGLHLLAHVALGFVVHKGPREVLTASFTHDDAGATHWLEVVAVKATTSGSLNEVLEAVELERVRVKPGGTEHVTLDRATHLQIREVLHIQGAGDA